LTRKQRRIIYLLVVLAVGILFLSTGIMDADWQAMKWHGNQDNGEMWTFITNVFVLQWYWAYLFTLIRLVVGPILCTVAVVILVGMIDKRVYTV
jgi:hypothetical protein